MIRVKATLRAIGEIREIRGLTRFVDHRKLLDFRRGGE